MEIVEVVTKKQEKKFLDFRKRIYKENAIFVDNNLVMLKQVFSKNTCFIKDKIINVLNVEENGEILCQGIVLYAKDLPEYIQLCFFESKKGQDEAVKLLLKRAEEIGKAHDCKRMVIGLNGHVNYGLGFLASHYDTKNSFSASGNPGYYNEYFAGDEFEKIYLNSYQLDSIYDRTPKYDKVLEKLEKKFTFKNFDKNNFDYYAKIYTDLNNAAFKNHKYYYERNYEEDKEMLKELFLFMNGDSLIFAFDGDKPVAFVMWYPNYNELAKSGDYFGAKHFIKNKLFGNKIVNSKIMEYGVLEEYRRAGIPLSLIKHCMDNMMNYKNLKGIESSWILEDNKDSNIVCQSLCDRLYKRYVVYEKEI